MDARALQVLLQVLGFQDRCGLGIASGELSTAIAMTDPASAPAWLLQTRNDYVA